MHPRLNTIEENWHFVFSRHFMGAAILESSTLQSKVVFTDIAQRFPYLAIEKKSSLSNIVFLKRIKKFNFIVRPTKYPG